MQVVAIRHGNGAGFRRRAVREVLRVGPEPPERGAIADRRAGARGESQLLSEPRVQAGTGQVVGRVVEGALRCDAGGCAGRGAPIPAALTLSISRRSGLAGASLEFDFLLTVHSKDVRTLVYCDKWFPLCACCPQHAAEVAGI